MLQLPQNEDDDSAFIALAQRTLVSLLGQVSPEEAFIVQIDNWFDHKWLDFPGRKSSCGAKMTAQTPVPCFTPARVVAQDHFLRSEGRDRYVRTPNPKQVHGYDGVFHGQHRKLADLTGSGVFLWYSGATLKTGRGSLMVYVYTRASKSSWYASFVRRNEWALMRAKGIAATELRWIAGGGTEMDHRG